MPLMEPIRLTASAKATAVRRSFMRRRKADATYDLKADARNIDLRDFFTRSEAGRYVR